jgi:hypothetical protein
MCFYQHHIQRAMEVISPGVKRPWREIDHLHPVPSLRKSGVINPLLRMSQCRAQGRRVLSLRMFSTSRMRCVRPLTLLQCNVKDALGKSTLMSWQSVYMIEQI